MLVLLSMAVSRLLVAMFAPILRRIFPPPKLTLEEALKLYCASLDPGPCPEFETLEAYRDDELSPPEVEALQEHLSLCSTCTQLYLDWVIPFSHCPSWEELEAYNAENVSDERHTEIRTHIRDCPVCAHFYVDLIRPGVAPSEYVLAREAKRQEKEFNRFLADYYDQD